MARVVIDKARMERVLNQMPSVQSDLDERARRVLRKAQDLAPRDTGDLARSLRVEKTFQGLKVIYRIVSDDPNIKEILRGTRGPYRNVPPWGPGSALGRWAGRHGFATNRAKFTLARRIATHGTNPAGTFEGKEDWIREALQEAVK